MTVLRVIAYIVAGWIGGVWVTLGADAARHSSWSTATTAGVGSAALFLALVVLLVRDVQHRRLHRKAR